MHATELVIGSATAMRGNLGTQLTGTPGTSFHIQRTATKSQPPRGFEAGSA